MPRVSWQAIQEGGWGAENPPTGGLPIDVQACATDTALRFMIGPLILVGIVIYLVVYLFKYGKDSPEKKERMILWGAGCFVLAVIVFALLMVYLSLDSSGYLYNQGWYENKWYANWCGRY